MSDKSMRSSPGSEHLTAAGFHAHWAYLACPAVAQKGWLPFSELRLPINDLGFRQGVTAVERLRTYSSRAFQVQAHLQRFHNTLRLIQIDHAPSLTSLVDLLADLLERNSALVASEGDVGITIVATPGQHAGAEPTLAMHLNRIDHAAVAVRRASGQPVVLTDIVQPDERSWSRQAKVRSRLHYYLADQQARQLATGSTGILQDSDGTWTESSIANIALVFGQELVWPPAARVLPGVTQACVRELAEGMSIASSEQQLTLEMIRRAEAVLLMGTDTGLWFASEVHGPRGEWQVKMPRPGETSLVSRLQRAWHASLSAPSA